MSAEGVYDTTRKMWARSGGQAYSYYEDEAPPRRPPRRPPRPPPRPPLRRPPRRPPTARRPARRPARRSSQARARGRPRRGGWKLSLPSIDQQLAGPKPGQPSPAGGSSAPVAPLTSTRPPRPSRAATAAAGAAATTARRHQRRQRRRQQASTSATRPSTEDEPPRPRRTAPPPRRRPPRGSSSASAAAPSRRPTPTTRTTGEKPPPPPRRSTAAQGALPLLAPLGPPSAAPTVAEPAPSTAPPLTSTALTPEQENEYYSEYYSDADGQGAPPPPRARSRWRTPRRAVPRRRPRCGTSPPLALPPPPPPPPRRACGRAPSRPRRPRARRWRRASPSRPRRSRRRRSTRASRPCWSSTSTPPCRATRPAGRAAARRRRRAPRGRGELLLLPKFIHLIEPGILDLRALSPLDAGPSRPRRGNHALALGAARCLGLALDGLEPSTLDDAPRREQAVLRLVWQLTRHALLARLTPRRTELLRLLAGGGRALAARARAPAAPLDQLPAARCARGHAARRHLRARWPAPSTWSTPRCSPCSSTGWRAAPGAPPDIPALDEASTLGRARAVLADAWAAGVQLLELRPPTCRPRMTLAFAARCSTCAPRCRRRRSRCRPRRAPPRSRRSARCAARAWLCSLRGGGGGGGGGNPAPPPRHPQRGRHRAAAPARDGRARRPARPGPRRPHRRRRRGRARRRAAAAAARVANCAYVLEVAQAAFGLKLGATSAADLAAGARQPMLNLVWQLQRASMLQALPPAMASEEALIAWANRKVAEAHGAATSPVDSLARKCSATASSGAAARRDRARGGARGGGARRHRAPADAQANASYAASCAHALGCPSLALAGPRRARWWPWPCSPPSPPRTCAARAPRPALPRRHRPAWGRSPRRRRGGRNPHAC